jgi:hypothetical protein
MDGQQEEPVLPPETVAQRMSRPIYFPVSTLKLVVLATCTFGLYEIYWFYRHWWRRSRTPQFWHHAICKGVLRTIVLLFTL